MRVKVSEIPDEGLELEGVEALPRPFADPAWSLDRLSLSVRKEGAVVTVAGIVAARVPAVCSRCLEACQLAVAPTVEVRFVPAPAGRPEEHELAADDLETDVYTGDEIDLGALVQGETELALPMKPLCRPQCQGLCPRCGANRNFAACPCADETVDPRWAPLRALASRQPR